MAIKNKLIWSDFAGFAAIIVIIVSILFIGIKITGYAIDTDTAVVNITIDPVLKINFTIQDIDFGMGNIEIGKPYAILDTLGNVVNGNWTPVTDGFRIENIGNVNASLYLKTNKTADEFLGGLNPSYEYNITNNEHLSCTPGSITFGEWNDVNITGDGTLICSLFQYFDDRDSINIDLKLVIPSDISPGQKSDVFTATAVAI